MVEVGNKVKQVDSTLRESFPEFYPTVGSEGIDQVEVITNED